MPAAGVGIIEQQRAAVGGVDEFNALQFRQSAGGGPAGGDAVGRETLVE